jgi:hypothetical protein
MQRVNGMGRIAAAADSSYPLQQLRKAGPGRHTALDYKKNTSDCNSSCSSKLSIFCKVGCLKIASALDYQTRTTNQKVGGMELESWSWGGKGREMDDDPFLKKKLSSLRSSKLIFLLKQTGFYHLNLERVYIYI